MRSPASACPDAAQYGEHVNAFEPLVSADGLVLAPQTCLHGGGWSAELITHAWCCAAPPHAKEGRADRQTGEGVTFLSHLSPPALSSRLVTRPAWSPHGRYLGVLDRFWRRLPRVVLNHSAKPNYGIEAMFMDIVSIRIVCAHLPRSVLDASWRGRSFVRPLPGFDKLVRHMDEVLPLRYSDPEPYVVREKAVVGGAVGGAGFLASRL